MTDQIHIGRVRVRVRVRFRVKCMTSNPMKAASIPELSINQLASASAPIGCHIRVAKYSATDSPVAPATTIASTNVSLDA